MVYDNKTLRMEVMVMGNRMHDDENETKIDIDDAFFQPHWIGACWDCWVGGRIAAGLVC